MTNSGDLPSPSQRHQMHAAVEQFCMSEPESGDDDLFAQVDAKRHKSQGNAKVEVVSSCSGHYVGGKRNLQAGVVSERPRKLMRPS